MMRRRPGAGGMRRLTVASDTDPKHALCGLTRLRRSRRSARTEAPTSAPDRARQMAVPGMPAAVAASPTTPSPHDTGLERAERVAVGICAAPNNSRVITVGRAAAVDGAARRSWGGGFGVWGSSVAVGVAGGHASGVGRGVWGFGGRRGCGWPHLWSGAWGVGSSVAVCVAGSHTVGRGGRSAERQTVARCE
jgi:hypothetical protein